MYSESEHAVYLVHVRVDLTPGAWTRGVLSSVRLSVVVRSPYIKRTRCVNNRMLVLCTLDKRYIYLKHYLPGIVMIFSYWLLFCNYSWLSLPVSTEQSRDEQTLTCSFIDYAENEYDVVETCVENHICAKRFNVTYISIPPYNLHFDNTNSTVVKRILQSCCGECVNLTESTFSNISEVCLLPRTPPFSSPFSSGSPFWAPDVSEIAIRQKLILSRNL